MRPPRETSHPIWRKRNVMASDFVQRWLDSYNSRTFPIEDLYRAPKHRRPARRSCSMPRSTPPLPSHRSRPRLGPARGRWRADLRDPHSRNRTRGSAGADRSAGGQVVGLIGSANYFAVEVHCPRRPPTHGSRTSRDFDPCVGGGSRGAQRRYQAGIRTETVTCRDSPQILAQLACGPSPRVVTNA